MDKAKLEQYITENMKSVFGYALTRLGNTHEAEELASDIIYEIIKSADNLKNEERFYGFMWRIAGNVYAAYLRKKSRSTNHSAYLDPNMPDDSSSVPDKIIDDDEKNLLHRELSFLSNQYREAMVLYYFENLSCSEIAVRQKISTEMVKYYLFRARKIVMEGMHMERIYGEKSYNPNYVKIDFWGTLGGQDNEYWEFSKRKVKGNILLAAYYTPVTVQEISMELGVSVPFLEDEIEILCSRQYLIQKNGKYLTNIPIFSLESKNIIEEKLKCVTKAAAERFGVITDDFERRFGNRFADKNLMHWQKLLLCSVFALDINEEYLTKKYGELPETGPYSIVNEGGGRGLVWAYEDITPEYNVSDKETIRGIYESVVSSDKRGFVIAVNFGQTLNAQHFQTHMTDSLVAVSEDRFDCLPSGCRENLQKLGYVNNGKANFAVWTKEEYDELRDILHKCTEVIKELDRQTIDIAAEVTADLAPTGIRKTAEYAGAIRYRSESLKNLVNTLLEANWIKAVKDTEKPSICVVKNE